MKNKIQYSLLFFLAILLLSCNNGMTVSGREYIHSGKKWHKNKQTVKRVVIKDTNDIKTLRKVLETAIKINGFDADLNFIDVSQVKNMEGLFAGGLFLPNLFTGDISSWDVSHVTNMKGMFFISVFNGDISGWDVSNVKTFESMFSASGFRGDVSGWDVRSDANMEKMFMEGVSNVPSWFTGKLAK
ncbi:surface protein [Elysia marginata]|uniref:Surface protein n=1 Tax=Elysia marginata TaxID=1093978 RepID=A0AAV4FQB3_9GAST|nr:surface protein [Elysia marginata]